MSMIIIYALSTNLIGLQKFCDISIHVLVTDITQEEKPDIAHVLLWLWLWGLWLKYASV